MGSGVGRVKAEYKGWERSVRSNGVRRGNRVRDEELGRREGSKSMERESNRVGSVNGVVWDSVRWWERGGEWRGRW